ncbi:MAG: hypothetical protein WC566_01840 [Dehalococcoidia bacterium]
MWHEQRTFPEDIIRMAWKRQGGKCARCGKKLLTANRDKGTVGSWHPHPKCSALDYDIADNCVLLCTDKPENCHFKVGHAEHHMLTYAMLEDWDLPFLYAGTRYKREGQEYKDAMWKREHPDCEDE